MQERKENLIFVEGENVQVSGREKKETCIRIGQENNLKNFLRFMGSTEQASYHFL